MTDAEIKTHLTEWVKDYTNNDLDITDLPSGVELFLNQGVSFIKNQSGVSSESLGDHSISWTTDFPRSLLKLLSPYRKAKII